MSQLTVTKVVEFDGEPNFQEVLNRLRDAVEREFDKVDIQVGRTPSPMLYCRVKTKLFNPIVSLSGPISIQTKGSRAKIMIDADTATNGWFWFSLVLGFFFPLLWLLMAYMYLSQKKASAVALEKVFERLAFGNSTF